MSLRRIDYDLPKIIFDQSNERYIDQETKHFIATMEIELYNKLREVMVAYIVDQDITKLLTIHPLKGGAKRESNKEWQMEENLMKDFRIYYDEEEDILYLAREGQEEEVVEISPGVNIELDKSGKLMGVEIFKASHLFKDVIKVMEKRLQAA